MKRIVWLVLLSGCPAGFERGLNGRPYPCDPGGGEDPADGGLRSDGGARQCALGWRCGLERVCHPRDTDGGELRPYLCTDDSWCEGDWECGPEGRCGPHIPDELRADAGGGAMTREWMSPRNLTGPPDNLCVAPDESVGPGFYGSAAAYMVDGHFELLGRARLGSGAGDITGPYLSYFFSAAVPTGVKDLACSVTAAANTLVLSSQGVGYVVTDFQDAGPGIHPGATYVEPWSRVQGDSLRLVPSEVPYAVAFDNRPQLTELDYPELFPAEADAGFSDFHSTVWSLAVLPVDGGRGIRFATQLTDVTAVSFGAGHEVLAASVDGELFFAERQILGLPGAYTGAWLGLAFDGGALPTHVISDAGPVWGNATILPGEGTFAPLPFAAGYVYPDAGPFRVGRLRVAGTRLAMEAFFGSTPQLVLADMHYSAPPGLPGSQPFPFAVLPLPPCRVCPPGFALADFRPINSLSPLMEARCVDAGVELSVALHQAVGDFRCGADYVSSGPGPLGDHYISSTGLVGHGGWAGAHGQLWQGESISDVHPFILDRPPQVLVSDRDEVAAVDQRVFFFHHPVFGFLSVSGLANEPEAIPVASVVGQPEWIITQYMNVGRRTRPEENIGADVLKRGTSIDKTLLREPYHAAIARSGSGGAVVFASSNDGVFAGDATRQAADPHEPAGTIEFCLVPSVRVPVRSLAAVDAVPGPDGGAPYAHAWLLAGPELFEVVGETPELWRSRSVAIPGGLAVKVVADGAWGRVGYSDGRVLSLPQLKPLAPAFDAGFEDFYNFHGQVWALGGSGLWRLQSPEQGVTGTWVRELEAAPDGGAFEYRGGRFYEAAQWLFIINSYGQSFRLQ